MKNYGGGDSGGDHIGSGGVAAVAVKKVKTNIFSKF